MSLILDALNRSEAERRQPDAVPGLHTDHGAPDASPVPAWRRYLWPGAVAILAVVAVLSWVPGEREPRPGQDSDAAAPSLPAAMSTPAVESAVVQQPVDVPDAEPEATPLPGPEPGNAQATVPVAGPEVAALYSGAKATGAPPPDSAEIVENSGSAPRNPERVTAGSTGAGGAQDGVALAQQSAFDVDALARVAEEALADGGARRVMVEHEAPFIVDLRQSLKDEIPSIFYSAHNWASSPAQRSVILNGEVRRAGEQVKPGLRLVEILEDSIVLDFRGTEFRLRSLNSWVNL